MSNLSVVTVSDLSTDFSLDSTGIIYISDAALEKIKDAIFTDENFDYVYDMNGNCVGSVAKMCPQGSQSGNPTFAGDTVDVFDLAGNRLGSLLA